MLIKLVEFDTKQNILTNFRSTHTIYKVTDTLTRC